MQWSTIPIRTIGLGDICSGSFVVFISGKKGHRLITKDTCLLSHTFTDLYRGKYHELISRQKEFDLAHERIVKHYIKHTKFKTKKDVEKYLLKETDVWLTPEEAVEYGIADKIV
jgi:ATP-dependent protease ClpP protease subunit